MQATDGGPNPHYEGTFDGEREDLANLRRTLAAENADLQSRLSAAERERDEAIAWGEKLKDGLVAASYRLRHKEYAHAAFSVAEALMIDPPAAAIRRLAEEQEGLNESV